MTKKGLLDSDTQHILPGRSQSRLSGLATYDAKVPAPHRPPDSDNFAGNSIRSLKRG